MYELYFFLIRQGKGYWHLDRLIHRRSFKGKLQFQFFRKFGSSEIPGQSVYIYFLFDTYLKFMFYIDLTSFEPSCLTTQGSRAVSSASNSFNNWVYISHRQRNFHYIIFTYGTLIVLLIYKVIINKFLELSHNQDFRHNLLLISLLHSIKKCKVTPYKYKIKNKWGE